MQFYATTLSVGVWAKKPGKPYATPGEAEKAARRYTRSRGEPMDILALEDGDEPRHARAIAGTVLDNLDRVWTEVYASPGQPCLL